MSIIHKLTQGYSKFQSIHYHKIDQDSQKPEVLMIACSDSRIDPALLFNFAPGEVFMVRNVANLVPPYERDNTTYHGVSAAIQFAVNALEIKHIIVLGHDKCGGVTSLFEGDSQAVSSEEQGETVDFIKKWMDILRPVSNKIKNTHINSSDAEKIALCCRESIANSLANLVTFPWIAERLKRGDLKLHGWNFDITTGALSRYCEIDKKFVDLNAAAPLEITELRRYSQTLSA